MLVFYRRVTEFYYKNSAFFTTPLSVNSVVRGHSTATWSRGKSFQSVVLDARQVLIALREAPHKLIQAISPEIPPPDIIPHIASGSDYGTEENLEDEITGLSWLRATLPRAATERSCGPTVDSYPQVLYAGRPCDVGSLES